MGKITSEANRKRHNFLLDIFFENTENYAEKEIKNWVLVKHINNDTGDFEVAIYTKEAFQKYKNYSEAYLFPSQVDKT